MNAPVLQFDDFAEDAGAMRAAVIAGGFTSEIGPDGAKYTGISKLQVPQWFDRISEFLKRRIIPRLSCFRLNLAGEMPHSYVHSDDICARYASVLYLNLPEQCRGGTAFWRHEGLKIDQLPSKERLAKLGWNADWFYAMMTREWKVLDFWKQYAIVPMQWNRFITYRTSFFHSRYPFEAFGNGPEDGRLIWVCFYDVDGEA